VLVEVHAAAITFAELTWDETWTRDGLDRTPVIPSHEFSGVVVAQGADLDPTAPAPGAEVFGLVPFDRDGAAAEYVAVPAANLAAKPGRLSHVEASALPLAAATAWQALVHHAGVGKGDRVLVLGGAGGVGAFAVQIARALGADVTTTVLTSHLDFARGLGADRVIDVSQESFDGDEPSYDVVIDTVGGDTLRRSFAVLRRGGRLVTLQAPPDADLAREHGVEAVFFIVGPDRETLAAVADLADRDQLHIEIAATYPLTGGRAAYLSGAESPRPPGKTVLVVR
jgi:NADPH:quinone reductase-like Zn-dependent oxidoreductase